MQIAVIIPAAGASRRYLDSTDAEGMRPLRHKIDEDLGGRPLLHRTVELFNKHPDVGCVIVAGPADKADFEQFKSKHADRLGLLGVKLCQGGATHRYQTVFNALKLVPESCTHVAVHDAARPCTPPPVIERVFEAARAGHPAVICGVDVADTLKRVSTETVAASKPDPVASILGDDASNAPQGRLVEQTIDRSHLVSVQTPQVFERSVIARAYAQKDLASTDDAQLVERLGVPVVVVAGDACNIKVTRASDLHLARAILGVRPPAEKAAHKRF